MAEPFDSNGPGDETRRYGQYVDGDSDETLHPGEAVDVASSGPTFSRHENGNQVAGIVYVGGSGGTDDTTVKTFGTHVAKVTSNASVGGTVGSHGGSDADWETGDLSADGDEYLVLDTGTKSDPRDGNDEDYAEVLKL